MHNRIELEGHVMETPRMVDGGMETMVDLSTVGGSGRVLVAVVSTDGAFVSSDLRAGDHVMVTGRLEFQTVPRIRASMIARLG